MAPCRVLFYGTPEFSTFALQALLDDNRFQVCGVITQPDRPAGRSKKPLPSPVKLLATKHSIPVLQPESIRKEKRNFLQSLASFGTLDIAVVSAFGQIIPLDVLEYPSHASINIHASLLPRWRGAAPIQRAIMAGDKETGICLMKMEAGLDTGPVYVRSIVPIDNNDTAGTLHDKLAEAGALLLKAHLLDIASGEISSEPQSENGVQHAAKITPEDMIIDWGQSATDIDRKIRALAPVPGSYTFFRGKRLKIFQVEEKNAFTGVNANLPGQIHMVDKGQISVQCGEGTLSLLQIQPEGKKKMLANEFIQGYQPKTDEQLGGSL